MAEPQIKNMVTYLWRPPMDSPMRPWAIKKRPAQHTQKRIIDRKKENNSKLMLMLFLFFFIVSPCPFLCRQGSGKGNILVYCNVIRVGDDLKIMRNMRATHRAMALNAGDTKSQLLHSDVKFVDFIINENGGGYFRFKKFQTSSMTSKQPYHNELIYSSKNSTQLVEHFNLPNYFFITSVSTANETKTKTNKTAQRGL